MVANQLLHPILPSTVLIGLWISIEQSAQYSIDVNEQRLEVEVVGLTWDRVEGHRAVTRDKNGHPKSAVICGTTAEVLERRRSDRAENCPWVFHRDGRRVVSFRKSWVTAVRKSGLGRHIVFHDLRRSFINNGRQAGVNRLVLMEMSGHRTHAVHDRYNFISEEEHREAALRIQRALKWAPSRCRTGIRST